MPRSPRIDEKGTAQSMLNSFLSTNARPRAFGDLGGRPLLHPNTFAKIFLPRCSQTVMIGFRAERGNHGVRRFLLPRSTSSPCNKANQMGCRCSITQSFDEYILCDGATDDICSGIPALAMIELRHIYIPGSVQATSTRVQRFLTKLV